MQIVIDIPKAEYEDIKYFRTIVDESRDYIASSILNGTPFDTHDEEIIATTVESIWGKPPYAELLDKIRAEIHEYLCEVGYTGWIDISKNKIEEDIFNIIDKYRAERGDKECR